MTTPSSPPTYLLAPLAGYTDLPFRMACRRFGLVYAHTPLIDAGALVYGNRDNPLILARGPEEPWLATQVLGSQPENLRKAGAMLNAMDFDVIDFNMGCPMKKVVNRDAGAALLNDPELALTCVQVLRDVVTRPLTIKMRILDADDPAPTVALCQRLHACGVDGIAIHGRIASKIYSGPVAATIIKAVRDSLPASFPITANGGIFSYADAERLRLASGCDRLMIARGAIGNPWLFRDLLAGTPPTPIDHAEICEVMHEHILGMIALYGETGAMILGRKTVLSYLCGRGYRRTLRAQASTIATKADFDALFAAVEKEGPIGLPGEAVTQD
ncbi:MAG: tRNA-dihydrouridine synthase family protein [Lentisphaerae bacterium]|jgi:tRNA-dihydrouridine synthase B|nr:tRNA-dihydrouridine synthase family protein [Lentisphaerota bacterium]